MYVRVLVSIGDRGHPLKGHLNILKCMDFYVVKTNFLLSTVSQKNGHTSFL